MPLTPPGRLSPAALGIPLYAAPPGPQAPPIPPFGGGRAQVLIAWATGPFDPSPAWTDVTAYVRFEQDIAMQRGRQDQISAISAGHLTLTVDNSGGEFTAGRSGSPWAPNVKIGRRIQVNIPDENGAPHTRFDGLITELPAQWEGPSGQVNLAVIQASDILAWLGRQPPLLSWTQQEMLADGPVALWSLADSPNVTSAADQAGRGAAPLQVVSQGDGTGTASAGGAPLTEIQTSGVVAAQQVTQVFTFTNPGSFSVTLPAGTLVSCRAQCWAGGTAGVSGGGSGGSGGKSAEYAEEPALAVTPGLTYTGTVGAPGAPSGGTGGDTTFTGDAVTVTAHGSGSGSSNTLHFSGASGGANQVNNGGGGASSAGPYQAGNPGLSGATSSPGTAVTGSGAGGAGDKTGAGAGPGAAPGGGGGGGFGGTGPTAGGAGGAGQVVITYTCIPPPAGQQNSAVPSWLFTPSPTLAARILSGPLPQPVTAAAGFTVECRAAFAGLPSQSVTTVTAPGPVSFTGPPGVLTADTQCWAGGNAGTNGAGAGGTGGEYAEEPALAITPDSTYSGSAGAPGAPSGGAGGDTSFTGDSVTVLAHGSGSSSTNTIHFSGGGGGSAGVGNGGGGGSSAGLYQAGNAGLAGNVGSAAGGTAVTGGGAGGQGDTTGAGGTPGSAPGGGGGGGKTGAAGGSGGAGQMIITCQPSVSALLTLVNPRGQAAIAVWVTATGHLQLASTSGYGTRAPSWTTVDAGQVPSAAFHVAVSVASSTGIATLYVNGASAGTLTLPAGASYTRATAGGSYGSWLGGWNGSAGLLAVYPAPLSSARIGVHYTAGTTGFAGTPTGNMIAKIAAYTGLPPFYYTAPSGTSDPSYGLSAVSYLDLNGQQPLAAMQQYAAAEAGVLYVSAAGKLTFADRASRYAAGSAAQPAFTLAAGQYGLDTSFKANDQYLTTAACFATANIPGGFPVSSTAAKLDYGPYTQNAGSPSSPQTAPFADAAATAGTYSTDDVMDAGQWETGVNGQPVPRVPALTVDLLTIPAAELSTASFYGTDIGSALLLAGLPSQAPDAAGQPLAAYCVIEGVNETLGQERHDVQMYTSPLAQNAAWIPGDTLLGVLGTTGTVGRSAAPAALGPPYTPVVTFGATLNRTGSAGAQDWRTLTVNTQNKLTPPLLIGQQAAAQTLVTAAGQAVSFDTLLADTAGGMATTTTYTIPAGFAGWWWASAAVQAATGNGSLSGLAIRFAATLAAANIATTSGSATAPAAFTTFAGAGVPAGTYTVNWTVTLSGTVGAPEANNFILKLPDGTLIPSVNPAAAGTYPQSPVTFTTTGGNMFLQSGANTATAGSVYSETMTGRTATTQWHARSLPYLSSAPYNAIGISGKIGPFSAGDTIQVICAWSGTAATVPLGVADGGSMLTLMWEGYT